MAHWNDHVAIYYQKKHLSEIITSHINIIYIINVNYYYFRDEKKLKIACGATLKAGEPRQVQADSSTTGCHRNLYLGLPL